MVRFTPRFTTRFAKGFGPGTDPVISPGRYLRPSSLVRTGPRYSLGSGVLLGTLEGDAYCISGREVYGINNASTLLVGNSNWYTDDAATGWRGTNALTPTQIDGRTVRVVTDVENNESNRKFRADVTEGNDSYVLTVSVKSNVVGVPQGGFIAIVNAVSDTIKAQTFFTANDEWQDITVIGVTDGASAGARLNMYGDSETDILYRDPVTTVGTKRDARFSEGSAAGTLYSADVLTVDEADAIWPAASTLIISKLDFTSGAISSVDSVAPTTGDLVLDGTDGNATYLIRVSDVALTAQEIIDSKLVMEAVLAGDTSVCTFHLIDENGDPAAYEDGLPLIEP